MPRLILISLFFAACSLTFSGCRQTTGTTVGGPLAAGSTLMPLGGGQTPTLGPFGQTTRVTPPATGSYVNPSNYIAPNNFGASNNYAAPGSNQLGNAGGASPANNFSTPIGSGIAQVGWGDPNGSAGNNRYASPPAAPNPVRGGMQVIDLTGAPAPPGYRPREPLNPAAFDSAPLTPAPYNPAPFNPAPQFTPQPAPSPQWQQAQTPGQFQPQAPSQFQAQLPAQFPAGAGTTNFVPGGITAPPTTNPVAGQAPTLTATPDGADPTLPWRRPGARF